MSVAALCERLQGAADRMTDAVLGQMYKDPFWRDRFGARADKHGRQDGKFHIDYLCEALSCDDPNVMRRYARWLQQVLTTRGMCTRHLAENFERLARVITDECWADSRPAVALLETAIEALRYDDVAAAAVQVRATELASAALATLTRQHAALDRDLAERELLHLVEYVADATALAMPIVLQRHVEWLADFHARHGLPASLARDALAAVRTAIAAAIPQHQASIAQRAFA